MPPVPKRIENDGEHGAKVPDDGDGDPAGEEALCEDPVAVQRQGPQDDGDGDVDDEIDDGPPEPPLDVCDRLLVKGVHDLVDGDLAVQVRACRAREGGAALVGVDVAAVAQVCALFGAGAGGDGLVDGFAAGQFGLQRAVGLAGVFDQVDAQELAPVELAGPGERDDDRVEHG